MTEETSKAAAVATVARRRSTPTREVVGGTPPKGVVMDPIEEVVLPNFTQADLCPSRNPSPIITRTGMLPHRLTREFELADCMEFMIQCFRRYIALNYQVQFHHLD